MESSWSCSIKCKFVKQELAFHFLPTAALLFACWKCVDQYGCMSFPHTQHMMTTILKYLIHSHGIDVSKNQFHKVTYISQGIGSMEPMPGVLNSLKIVALDWDLVTSLVAF